MKYKLNLDLKHQLKFVGKKKVLYALSLQFDSEKWIGEDVEGKEGGERAVSGWEKRK